MKVSLHITIEIDAEAWATEYGCSRKEVRADIREYIANALWDLPVRPTEVIVNK